LQRRVLGLIVESDDGPLRLSAMQADLLVWQLVEEELVKMDQGDRKGSPWTR